MKVHHTLICFFFLSLQDGNTLVNAQTIVYTGTGGGAVKVKCFSYYGGRKFFCKEGCNQEDILIQTTGVTAHNGRYSMTYDGTFTGGNVFVTITQLTKSDSGLYWCGSGAQYQLIEIIIVDGSTTSKPNLTLPAVSTSVPSTFTPTTQQTTATTDVWLYVGLTLAALVVLLSLAVLVYCRKKSTKPKEPREETEYTSVTETEDDSSNLIYSKLNFSNRTVGSPSSAPGGDSDNVVYSVPRVKASSDTSRAGDILPVYSHVVCVPVLLQKPSWSSVLALSPP
ncbi:uncharacterized protein LOC127377049 isoform X2 [Dicentrarchus labrax]|uniref:uncharacterized protein LOC127377049 isoform X2 n=1 Tax=Dicentrarchus labrax TaxID=13489 RepID=UPI0021F64A41|nr:uncharacterized protein LOC127377049 isoform X2 [Dicentrarchus labrax]